MYYERERGKEKDKEKEKDAECRVEIKESIVVIVCGEIEIEKLRSCLDTVLGEKGYKKC